MTRRRIFLGVALLLLLAMGGAFWYVASGSLDRYAAEKIIAAAQESFGAKLEFTNLSIDPLRGRAVASGIKLSGTGRPGDPPFFQAASAAISANWRILVSPGIELNSVELMAPEVRVLVYADGSNNLPKPRTRESSGQGLVRQLLALRLGKLTVRDGLFAWNDQKVPLAFTAEALGLSAEYLPASRAYRSHVETSRLTYAAPGQPSQEAALAADVLLDREKLRIEKARLSKGETWAEGSGEAVNLDNAAGAALKGEFDLKARVSVEEVNRYFSYPVEKAGAVFFEGKLLYEAGRGFEAHGNARGEGIYYRDPSTRIGPVAAKARVDYMPSRLTLTNLNATAFGGALDGAFRWDQHEGWSLEGDLNGLRVARLAQEAKLGDLPWDAVASGKIKAGKGKRPLFADLDLSLEGTQGANRIEGVVGLSYQEPGGTLFARDSFLRLPHTSLKFAGNLREGMRFEFVSSDAREWQPALRWAGWKEQTLPIDLAGGSARVAGQLSGSFESLAARVTVNADSFRAFGQAISRLSANASVSPELIRIDALELERPQVSARGAATVTLSKSIPFERSPWSGQLTAKLFDLAALAKEFSIPDVERGSAELSVTAKGTLDQPAITGSIRSPALTWRGESIESLSAVFSADRGGAIAPELEFFLAKHAVRGAIDARASSEDWKRGMAGVKLRTDRLPLGALRSVQGLDLEWGAEISSELDLQLQWSPEGVAPGKIDGKLGVFAITRFGRPVGQLEFTSRTSGSRAALTVQGAIRQQPVKGDANIQLTRQLDTELRVQLPRLDFPAIAQLLSRERIEGPLPYEGGAEASLYLRGPLLDSANWDGTLTIPQLTLAPNKDYVQTTLPRVSDVIVRNEGPIVLRYNKGVITARQTRFTAKDTNFNADFIYRLDNQTIGGRANGRINLAVLSTLQPELLASGVANLDATLAGRTNDPRLNGKLSFENASFYLRDVITGFDKVNGAILFDQNRATIERLRAQAGGGNLQLNGFVGFGKLLSYRLQAQADQVRIRYPEGVSTTANAQLALTGTTDQSILSGSVTILRATVGQVDAAQFLASGTTPEALTVSDNRYLKNLQFDVRVDAAQNAEFATSLTRDVKGEIALRLRGTPQRPALLGRVTVTQGEIDFFGNRYTISRGELRFDNPLRIDPSVNMDLETRVRGVVINMTFTGQANKLNMTYRSDPPLQSNEILALLTVGRNPNSTSTSVVQAQGQSQGLFGTDSSNVILGAAVSAGINGRLQRFFGISRVRLDPQLTGIDNVPQARLTLEQQVSRDVTLTYITNLNRTQQQIVRLDWDITRTWSVVAVRDENGVFGLDLFFRKRLK